MQWRFISVAETQGKSGSCDIGRRQGKISNMKKWTGITRSIVLCCGYPNPSSSFLSLPLPFFSSSFPLSPFLPLSLPLPSFQVRGVEKAKAYMESVTYFMRYGDAIEVRIC